MEDPTSRLSQEQQELLEEWLPGHVVTADLAWGLVDRIVVELEHEGRRYVLKAGGPDDHHEAREIEAYLSWAHPWQRGGLAPRMTHHDVDRRMLVVEHLPGDLVLGSGHEGDPEVFRQAGRLLRTLHGQDHVTAHDWEQRENERAQAWLGRPHRIPAAAVTRLRRDIASWPTPPTTLVPTHGDWQPRNWLIDDEGVVRVIDLGRAALRPAATDLVRLESLEFRERADLEAAFLEGYGAEPRDPDSWRRMRIREAVSTAAWAHAVGDTAFEDHGLAMVQRALEPSDRVPR